MDEGMPRLSFFEQRFWFIDSANSKSLGVKYFVLFFPLSSKIVLWTVIGDKVSHDKGLHYGLKGEYDNYEEPLHLAGPCGNGKPILNENGVFAFNGNEDEDGDYESFYVSLNDDRYEFGFCKTARKPYDVAVCLALLCLANEFGEDFSYSSDGDIEEGEEGWGVAKRVFNQVK